MPKPIKLLDPLYPTGGVSRLDKSNRWGASVSLGGNDLFLGSFSTQTQANAAAEIALETAEDEGADGDKAVARNDLPTNEALARAADLRSVRLEESVAAVEKEWTPERNFSLHNWTMQQIRRRNYLREKEEEAARLKLVRGVLEEYTSSRAREKENDFEVKKRILEDDAAAGARVGAGELESAPALAQKRAKKRKQCVPRRVNKNMFVYL